MTAEELKIGVDKLTTKISNREKGTTDLSEKFQELFWNKGEKQEHIKTLDKEIKKISDRLNEASLKIIGLKKKNNRREKDINLMAKKADKLMKKYNELKEKSIKDNHDQFDRSKQLNTVIGSRMMDYVLNKTYFKQMRISLNFIQGFSKFEKNFSHSIRLIVKFLTGNES